MPIPDRPVVDTLVLPLREELDEDSRYSHWLELADIALARARKEQDRIKEQIRPQIERYRRIKKKQASNSSK